MKSFFPADATFYKVNLHCHSSVSDGALTPAQIKEAYLAQGYAAVAFTDHEIFSPHNELTDGTFIALNAYEAAVKEFPTEHTSFHQAVYHLNMIAKSPDAKAQPFFLEQNSLPGNAAASLPALQAKERPRYSFAPSSVNTLISLARENGFFVSLNHPAWSLVPPAVYVGLEGLDAVEVMNTGSFINGDNAAWPMVYFRQAGKTLFPVGGDDNHNKHGMQDSFGAFTVLAARRFTYEGLIEALENGWLYVSNGPKITKLTLSDDVLCVGGEGDFAILFGEGRYTATAQNCGGVFSFPFDKCKLGTHFRVELHTHDGKKAVSRYYLTDESFSD